MTHYKLYLYLILLFAGCTQLDAQENQLIIIKQDLKKAQEVATLHNKLILVDFYTDWCRPCKIFDRQLEKDQETQKAIAANYIILKYNAEDDSLFGLSGKYHVFSYPTFMSVTSQLQYIDKLFGGSIGLDSSHKPKVLSYLKQSVRMAKNKEFAKGYGSQLNLNYPQFYKNREPASKNELENYWSSKPDLFAENTFALITYSTITRKYDSVHQKHFLDNLEKYETLYGHSAVSYITRSFVYQKLSEAANKGDSYQWSAAVKYATNHLEKVNVETTIEAFRLDYYLNSKNWLKAQNYLLKKRKVMTENEINYYAYTLYKSTNNNALLKMAEQWMKELTETNEDFAAMDTYACLLYKNKKYSLAKQKMEEAIILAKKNDDDYSQSEKILQLIKQKL